MKSINENESKILIEISGEEAIVLFEWLYNFNEKEQYELFEDQAEKRILFDLQAELEKVISAIFSDNYIDILAKAREKIRDKE
jgi:hypothetical protein